MPFIRVVLAASLLSPLIAAAQAPARVFAVAYVEAEPAAAAAARAALVDYRDAVRAQAGCLAVELFAQVGRPGRFAVIESWRDQQAFGARASAPRELLMEGLEPIRVSGYDERPYKALTLGRPDLVTSEGVYVIAHVDVAPNSQAPELLRTLADASRQEAGNLRLDVLQHTQRGNHFTVIEHWQSEAALDAHVAAKHTRDYRDALQPLTGSPLDERIYTSVDP